MAKNIVDSIGVYEDPLYYDPAFRIVLMDHLPLIKKAPATQIMSIDDNISFYAKGDLYLVFKQMRLAPKYWWITMILNNINSPEEFDGERTQLLLPDLEYIEDLYRLQRTVETNI